MKYSVSRETGKSHFDRGGISNIFERLCISNIIIIIILK